MKVSWKIDAVMKKKVILNAHWLPSELQLNQLLIVARAEAAKLGRSRTKKLPLKKLLESGENSRQNPTQEEFYKTHDKRRQIWIFTETRKNYFLHLGRRQDAVQNYRTLWARIFHRLQPAWLSTVFMENSTSHGIPKRTKRRKLNSFKPMTDFLINNTSRYASFEGAFTWWLFT